MSLDAVHAVIRTRFETEWAARTPVQYPNVKFDIPETEWVRLTINDIDAQNASMGDPGNNMKRHFGEVAVQIFVPRGNGEGNSLEHADIVRAMFTGFRDATTRLRFRVPPYTRQVGTERKWYQVNVFAPYEFDDYS